jgi:NADH-quinone oxidoreductase subunit M
MGHYSLSILTFLPLAGMIVILWVPRKEETTIKWVALIAAGMTLALAVGLYANFLSLPPEGQVLAGGGHSPFGEFRPWIVLSWEGGYPRGINYHLGVDGLSMPLILLTTLLTVLSLLYSWNVIQERVKEYYSFFLLLEVGMLGVFVSLDFFLFYIFWEVSLVPMYFLIGIWGHKEDRPEYCAIKFFLYTLVGSLAMLLGILALYYYSAENAAARTFDMVELATRQPLKDLPMVGALVFWGMFLGFAIKVPVWPFHTWLPDAHTAAPTAGSVILAGILLKMGTYGFVRVILPILPQQCEQFGWIIGLLAMISIIYGALVAMAQPDFKRLIAYSSVNHMGYVMLGVAAACVVAAQRVKPVGATMALNGAILQMIAHGIITGSLFLLVGVLYERTHTRRIDDFGGLLKQIPGYGGFLMLACFASLGLPALAGFMAEFHIFAGSFSVGALYTQGPEQLAAILGNPRLVGYEWLQFSLYFLFLMTCLSVIGVIITAAYLLWVIQRVLLGPLKEQWAQLPDMTPLEWISLAPLGVLMVLLGIYPAPVLNVINAMVHQTLADMGRF